MKSKILVLFLICVILLQTFSVVALTPEEAKELWEEAKKISKEKRQAYVAEQIEFLKDKSLAQRQKVVNTGKEALHAALDEAEAWLIWKQLEVDELVGIPRNLKDEIDRDVEINLEKIDALHEDVDDVTNQIELGVVFLKMAGSYVELVTDVARNSGKIWAQVGENIIDTGEKYEAIMRAVAIRMKNNEEIIALLDDAKANFAQAQQNIDKAEVSFGKVVLPGKPLINFAEGNNYLNLARADLLDAYDSLEKAYLLMTGGGK